MHFIAYIVDGAAISEASGMFYYHDYYFVNVMVSGFFLDRFSPCIVSLMSLNFNLIMHLHGVKIAVVTNTGLTNESLFLTGVCSATCKLYSSS